MCKMHVSVEIQHKILEYYITVSIIFQPMVDIIQPITYNKHMTVFSHLLCSAKSVPLHNVKILLGNKETHLCKSMVVQYAKSRMSRSNSPPKVATAFWKRLEVFASVANNSSQQSVNIYSAQLGSVLCMPSFHFSG